MQQTARGRDKKANLVHAIGELIMKQTSFKLGLVREEIFLRFLCVFL